MIMTYSVRHSSSRQGVILMVVLILLTLFAILGISFALYADAQAKSAQISREAESVITGRPDVDAKHLVSYFLDQLIYDTNDTDGIYSALRGHSLGRLMYGYNDAGTNNIPWAGVGRLHDTTTSPFASATGAAADKAND